MSTRQRAIEVIEQGSRFLVTGHRRPDADAMGSALGLAAILRMLGKEAVVYAPEEPSDTIRFLPGLEEAWNQLPADATFDAAWVMDTPAAALLPPGFPGPEVTGPVVMVDHHAAHDEYGDVVVREIDACATGEVVMRLLDDLGMAEVPPAAAVPLYAAVVADTGGFRHPGTRPQTLRLGARLLEAGADAWEVAYRLFEDWPRERLRLLGLVLDSLETSLDGRLATLRVTRAMLDHVGANEDMIEGMVNYGRALRGVEISALVWEQAPTEDGRPQTKISLRSRGGADVSQVAVALRGGGHREAAGTVLDVDVDTALGQVQEEAARVLP